MEHSLTNDNMAGVHEESYLRWAEVYESTRPKPVRKTVNVVREYGWEWVLGIVATLSSMVLSALRTGFMFYVTAQVSARNFMVSGLAIDAISLLEMATAIFGIEGSIVVFGLKRGRDRKSTTSPMWGIVIALFIAVSASLGQNLEVVGLGTQMMFYVRIFIAIIIGFGAPLVAFANGDALGGLIAKGDLSRSKFDEEYDAEMVKWNYGLKVYSEKHANKHDKAFVVTPSTQYKASDRIRVKMWLQENNLTADDVLNRIDGVVPRKIAEDTGIRQESVRVALSRLRKNE